MHLGINQVGQEGKQGQVSNQHRVRSERMQAILDILRPHKTEFTRMVESKHTKESSLKWSKLKWEIQKQPHSVLTAFTKSLEKDQINDNKGVSESKEKSIKGLMQRMIDLEDDLKYELRLNSILQKELQKTL